MLLDPRALWTREEVGQYLGKIDVKTVDRLIATRLPPNEKIICASMASDGAPS